MFTSACSATKERTASALSGLVMALALCLAMMCLAHAQSPGAPPQEDPNAAGQSATYINGVILSGQKPIPPTPSAPVQLPPSNVLINFDDGPAPCGFMYTIPLRDQYASAGVVFEGPGPNDGGAILNECGNFCVSGHSAPNFLAFNCGAQMLNGGIPIGPEVLIFTPEVASVSALVAEGCWWNDPVNLMMKAYDQAGTLADSAFVTLGSTLRVISVSSPVGITRVEIGTIAPCVWVLDDLGFSYPDCSCGLHGDCDDNGAINVADAIYLINYAFNGGMAPFAAPGCPAINRGDWNCDGQINLLDVTGLARYIYRQPAPGPCDPCAP